jgi:predicted RNase H-like nuclease (RuvC/YqgF family)
MIERLKITVVLAFLLLVAGLACVGSLRAQLKKEEVDFEVLATVTAQKGKNCCLWNMAAKYYGDPYEWSLLKEVNKIPDERKIAVGTVVYIPKKPLKKIEAEEKVSEVDKLMKEISLLKKKNRDCANNLKKCNAEKSKLAKQLRQCKAAKAAPARKVLRDCEAKNKKLMADLKKLEAEKKRVGADIKELNAKNRRLTRAMKEKDDNIEELEGRARRAHRECEEELARKNRRIEELELALDRCHRELEELEAERVEVMEKKKMKEPPKLARPPCEVEHRSLIAAVAIALVGSIIWIASD